MLSIETESFGVVVADGDIMLIGVVACRAYFRRFCAGIFVAADEALPCNGFGAFPERAVLNVFQITFKAVVVSLLVWDYGLEVVGDVVEAFAAGNPGGFIVEVDTFAKFFFGSRGQI